MSVKLMAEVWTLKLSRGERDVLMVMADHANDDGVCWPGVALIAWKTDYDRRSVQRFLRSLESSGLVEPLANESGGRGLSRLYKLHIEKGVRKSPFISEASEREELARLTSENTPVEVAPNGKGDTTPPFSERATSGAPTTEKGDTTARKGDVDARKGDTAMPPESSEPSEPPLSEGSPSDPDVAGRCTYEILQLTLRTGRRYPNRWKGHLAREIKNLLSEGFDYHVVLEAAKRCERIGKSPGLMPSLVNEVLNGSATTKPNGHRPFDPSDQNYATAEIR